MSSSLGPQAAARRADAKCYTCGIVFRYRKDKEKHQKESHGIVPAKPLPNDKPSWDTGPEIDAWSTPHTHHVSSTEPPRNAWSTSPTPAEAAKQTNKKASALLHYPYQVEYMSGTRNKKVHSVDGAQHDRDTSPSRGGRLPLQLESLRVHQASPLYESSSASSAHVRDSASDPSSNSTAPDVASHQTVSNQKEAIMNNQEEEAPSEKDQESTCGETVITYSQRTGDIGVQPAVNIGPSRTSNPRCFMCNRSFDDYSFLQKHLNETGHRSPRGFVCRICLRPFGSKADLTNHISVYKHYDPITTIGKVLDYKRIQKELDDGNYGISLPQRRRKPRTESAEFATENDQYNWKDDETPASAENTQNAAGASPVQDEEDLIDLDWEPSSEAALPSAARPSISSSPATSSLNAASGEFIPSPQLQPPKSDRTLSFSATATEFKPQKLSFSSPTERPLSLPQSPATAMPLGLGASTPNIPAHCWALCGRVFHPTTNLIQHLECAQCQAFPNQTDSVRALYKASADTACCHDFIIGRYLHDMTEQRDLEARYKGNAWPFICPNEKDCKGVFRKLHELFEHWELEGCAVELGTSRSVKRMLEERLPRALSGGKMGAGGWA